MAPRSSSVHPLAPPSGASAVEPAWLEARLGIPSVRNLDVRAMLFDAVGDVVSGPELALVMSGLGVGDHDTVVLVDEGRPDAATAAAWALARYGLRDVVVLEGSFARWASEHRPVSREIVRHPPASFTARGSS
jgi:3-mercaptopyruvate sulfurtransferase SseA